MATKSGKERKAGGQRVGFELTFRIEPRHREEFLQTADTIAKEAVTTRPVCFEKIDGANRFLWRECWDTQSALEERLSSVEVRALLGAIEVLGRLDRMQEIEWRDSRRLGDGRPS